MIEHLNKLLSSTQPTGYQTIIISIITTLITSILLYNFKVIVKISKKVYIKLKSIIQEGITRFIRYIRLKTNREISKDILYLKREQKQRELKKYEKTILERHYKCKCLSGKLSLNEWSELQRKKDNNEPLEDYEIEGIKIVTEKLSEATKEFREHMAYTDIYIKDSINKMMKSN